MYRGMHCEVVSLAGHNGDQIEAYHARALGDGPHPSVVVIHHMPGWDDWTLEVARRITHHGYATLSDDQVMGDITASAAYLRAQAGATGKVGVIGFCSGGRQAYLAACRIRDLDAAVDCWGGAVVVDDPAQLDEKHPVAPIDLTAQMSAPLLGIFGNDDRNPTAAQVDRTEAELKRHSKTYEFHRYDGAGHAFFHWGRPEAYRGEQAIDAWSHVFAFFARHLGA